MSDTCETVVIQTKGGPVEINKSDFDPAIHKLDQPAPKKARPARAGK